MSDKEIIRKAFAALCNAQSPALTKRQQEEQLGRCWEILSEAVYREDDDDDPDSR